MKVQINASELVAATNISGKDKSRPVLCGVYVENNSNGYAIASTDSFKLIEFTNEHIDTDDSKEENYGSVIIDSTIIKQSIKASDKYVIVETTQANEYEKTTVKLTVFDKKHVKREIITKAVDGKFPDYKGLLKPIDSTSTNNYVGFNPAYMTDICNAVKKAYGKNACIKMEFNGSNRPMRFTAINNGKENNCTCILMPVRI